MTPQRVLLLGSNGLLGQKVTELLARNPGYQITLTARAEEPLRRDEGTSYRRLDITSRKDVKTLVHALEPHVIINCAAMTNVDHCEKERELAWKINVEGVENIVDAAKKNEPRIVHVSTDYIFDGKHGPYDELARPEPINYYGKTKLASENVLRTSGLRNFIARTMVLYGYAPGIKANFALWLIQNLEQGTPVRIVDDQEGNATLVDDLAHGIMSAIELDRAGIYNIAGREIMNRFDFALILARIFDFDASLITRIKTPLLRQPALRPLKSGLITLKAEVDLGFHPSTTEEALRILRSQLNHSRRKMPDSAPVRGLGTPGGRQGSGGKKRL
jgi:dTDP-4-dehydrorhamnose reductase